MQYLKKLIPTKHINAKFNLSILNYQISGILKNALNKIDIFK